MNGFKAIMLAGTAAGAAIVLCQAALAALSSGAMPREAGGVYNAERRELATVDTFEFREHGIVDLKTGNGSIQVDGWDRPDAELTVTRSLSGTGGFLGFITGTHLSDKHARALLEATPLEVSSGEGVLRVRTQDGGYSEPQVTTHLALKVPRSTALRIASNNGRVLVHDVAETLEAYTDNGAMEIERVAGVVVAHTKNGRMRLAAIDGDVDAATNNGAIECDGASGSVELETSNGAIETRGVRGEALRCTTSNGSITVRVANGDAYDLDLHTDGGAVQCDLPLDLPSDEHERGLRGTVRGGGKVLALRTGNGSITVGEE